MTRTELRKTWANRVAHFEAVLDLADAHLEALAALEGGHSSAILNVGTGQGHSALEVIRMAEKVSGRAVPMEYGARRPGTGRFWWRSAVDGGTWAGGRRTGHGRS